jgi:hypothetical protein
LGGFVSWCSGVAVIQKQQEPPLHLPQGHGGGDKGRRQDNPRQRVEYWKELLGYVDAAYVRKFGRHYAWNNLARKNLWNLARAYAAWEVMALWDLYLESECWWARQTGWSVYGMVRDVGRLMDDARLKSLATKHEEYLSKRGNGAPTKPIDVFNSLFSASACKLNL